MELRYEFTSVVSRRGGGTHYITVSSYLPVVCGLGRGAERGERRMLGTDGSTVSIFFVVTVSLTVDSFKNSTCICF